jgi:hypothetical protein
MYKIKFNGTYRDELQKWKNISNKKFYCINYILDFEIVEDYMTLETKGHYMEFCKKYDTRISAIDSAIPLEVSKQLHSLNVSTLNLCGAYFKNGTFEVINVVEYASIVYLRNTKYS